MSYDDSKFPEDYGAEEVWDSQESDLPADRREDMKNEFGLHAMDDGSLILDPKMEKLAFLFVLNNDGQAVSRIRAPQEYVIYALRSMADALETQMIEHGLDPRPPWERD